MAGVVALDCIAEQQEKVPVFQAKDNESADKSLKTNNFSGFSSSLSNPKNKPRSVSAERGLRKIQCHLGEPRVI